MNARELTIQLKDAAYDLGFDDVGVASVSEGTPSNHHFLAAIRDERHGPLDYLEKTAEKRADISRVLPGARFVLLVVKNYYTGDHSDYENEKKLDIGVKVARYAWGRDYHSWFKKRLRKLREKIFESTNYEYKAFIFNDCGPVLERAWAQKAGLGFVGKSAMFIHRQFGTWTLLGGLITDAELVPDKPSSKQLCGSCTACIDACPSKAILSPGKIDARLCVSTWNIERPLHPGANDKRLVGHGWGFGCDICQEACPWNKFERVTVDSHFQPRKNQVVLDEDRIPAELNGTPLARARRDGLTKNIARAKRK